MKNKKRSKSSHGTITVHSSRGRLRLVFTYMGKRRYLYLGIPDSVPARGLAELIARRIETDIYSEQFDESLESYRPEKMRRTGLTVLEIVERFFKYKQEQEVIAATVERWQALLNWVKKSPMATAKADSVADHHAAKFLQLIERGGLAPAQRRRRMGELRTIWEWAQSERLIPGERNPWARQHRMVKVPPRQPPKPFTKVEVHQIIQGFRDDPFYSHFGDFVEFLFLTGCRTSEACGLRWRHLSANCGQMWIGEMLVRRLERPGKNLKARDVRLSDRVQKLLIDRRPEHFDPDKFVFSTKEGRPLSDDVFRARYWIPMLKKLGLPYKKPYLATRGGFVTHCLEAGISPNDIAKLTGHSVKILFQHYAGHLPNNVKLPDIFCNKAQKPYSEGDS